MCTVRKLYKAFFCYPLFGYILISITNAGYSITFHTPTLLPNPMIISVYTRNILLTCSFINIFLSETLSEPISLVSVDLNTRGKVPGVWCQTRQVKAAPNPLPILINADNLSFKYLNQWSMQGQHSDFQLQSEEAVYERCEWRWRRVPRISTWHISTFMYELIGHGYDAWVYMAYFLLILLFCCSSDFTCLIIFVFFLNFFFIEMSSFSNKIILSKPYYGTYVFINQILLVSGK